MTQKKADAYEIVFIMKNNDSKAPETITNLIEEQGGKIEKKDAWGVKRFSYPIKKETQGTYFDWYFTLHKSDLKSLSKKLEYSEELLRFLLLKVT
ncbi:30S ribosomal protein S6 [Candidatus Roizmanbacteria bacterium RIFCSPHIGHO2_02_FULL_37_13b]|uniref:Small ribosomal subunit protein bS6 n=1 Tax=Candidatus Roizmanbacteria bacterium RIFCSPLOWO2_02_FULL_36_11 TaxID=1802071 RepID=A0A1F7JD12_9BACT|nr:MAG: 30S ribosomal protein S6 [Candidatus Roizmanbacteria bacterium RIFCSPHIGHO2_02_FULL_37_13b]OGK53499.1 MAG: 30S ribosomal protein S6 [Candidatus Roizmanbacteria bacterium RIFCSPLOWO2_02_FULL_36_11]